MPDQLGMTILSVIPGNSLLWGILIQTFNLGIAKMFIISESVTSENLSIKSIILNVQLFAVFLDPL